MKYRLHNITDFGTFTKDFSTEKALNNYISIFVDEPYWVENLETNEKIFKGDFDVLKNVSRETMHETELQWINRNISEKFVLEEDETFTIFDKIMIIISFISVMTVFFVLGYLFLSVLSILVEWLSDFNWWFFNIL